MCEFFTCATIEFYPEFANHWIRFGMPDHEFDLDRRRAIAFFKPAKLFGYVRWLANIYGTQSWDFAVILTGEPTDRLGRFAGINPGGKILLHATGKVKVKRSLELIDALEDAGFDITNVSHAYFRHAHNRIAVGQPVRPYSAAQHAAFIAGRGVI